jgi:heme A synthase
MLALQIGQFEGQQGEVADAFRLGTGIFAFLLFFLSVYAWSRRKQPALLLVSAAFLLFFFKIIVEVLTSVYDFGEFPLWDLLLILIDFIILALFFMAVVIRPRRKRPEQDS